MEIGSAMILVTTAGSQIGSNLAMHFSSLGATVIICDTNKRLLDETYQRCYSISDRIHQFPLSDYSIQSIQQLFQLIDTNCHASPDVLINSFTAEAMPDIFDHSASHVFSQHLAVMANTLFAFSQATAERMKNEGKNGVIVNVIGYADQQVIAGFDNASSMVSGFTQSWAKELSPFNIRIGGVVPASTKNGQHWAEVQDDLIRNTEYIVTNDYFSGRVVAA
ncbi:SDR family oxidoreductase [Vibrio renipiscarius]|uniref:SDR family oxidoreductase n=1 Tax=Vibrio renipiscarius TaxID=1461322 RepID=UPI00354E079C